MRFRLEEESRSVRQVSADKASLEKAQKRGSTVYGLEKPAAAASVDSYGFFSEDKTAVMRYVFTMRPAPTQDTPSTRPFSNLYNHCATRF